MVLVNRLAKNKLIFIPLFVVLLFFILKSDFIQSLFKESEMGNKPVDAASIDKALDPVAASGKGEIMKKDNEKSVQSKEIWLPMGDEASKAKIISWFESRGVYGFNGPDEQNDYKNYDLETLKKLSETGDIRAMHLLAEKAESISASNVILYNAAVYGSTGALSQIALSIQTEFDIGKKSAEERKPYVLETLAYFEAAQLRGDWWGNIQGGASLLGSYPTDISSHDKKYIQARAQEIYDTLQQRRKEIGMGEFDNGVPEEVIKFYEEMLRPL